MASGAVVLSLALAAAQSRTPRTTLDIYVVDVEGGNATLFVPPSGESVLIDTGNGGAAGARDPERIMAAVKDAGLSQIDHLITTHWHGDHFGGTAELASRIPIRHYVDHGPTIEPQPASTAFLETVYPSLLAKATHTVAKPGDTIPVAGLDWRIVTSGGAVIKTPLPGAGAPNPYCRSFAPKAADTSENAQSVGSVVTFGKFRLVHLGDLTWNKEFELMCPNNPIGTVDLFVVSHHGQAISNADVLVHPLHSRVAILNNGTRKGGQPEAMKVLFSAPGLEDLWQMHFSLLSGQEHTPAGLFIANTVDDQAPTMPIAAAAQPAAGTSAPPPAHNGPAYWIKVSAQSDGSFTVTNARNHFSKTYSAAQTVRTAATNEPKWKSTTPVNDRPNPYRRDASWAQLPAGLKWGAVIGAEPGPDGNIYVVHRCFENSCAGRMEPPILKFDPSGKVLKSWGAGAFVFPHGLQVDGQGNVWVTDAQGKDGKGHQVFKYDASGALLLTIGTAGVQSAGADGKLSQPTDVVTASNGDIFITEGHVIGSGINRVSKWSKDGKFLMSWGKTGAGPGEFNVPHTIALDSRGRLFVGDRANNRIQIFDQNGKFLDEWTQFGRPSGITITKDDTIYVADSESWGPDEPGWKKGIRVGSAKDGSVKYFIEDIESKTEDHSGAEGVGVDRNGNVYGSVVRRMMLEKHILQK
jgi:beta-lactamase superfamily II metal-dependent hydrolase